MQTGEGKHGAGGEKDKKREAWNCSKLLFVFYSLTMQPTVSGMMSFAPVFA